MPSKPERCRWGQSVSTLVTLSAIEVPNLKQDFSLGCGFKGEDLCVLYWLTFIPGNNRRISIPDETWVQRKPNHAEKMTRKPQGMLQWCKNFNISNEDYSPSVPLPLPLPLPFWLRVKCCPFLFLHNGPILKLPSFQLWTDMQNERAGLKVIMRIEITSRCSIC